MIRLGIVCPVPPTYAGNHATARRYAAHFRALGHRVRILPDYEGERLDLLVALHARRSAAAVGRYRRRRDGPLVVVLTGTDLYRDLPRSDTTRRTLALADRLVLLQPAGRRALPPWARRKARVILQSAPPTRPRPRPPAGVFAVAVVAALRPVKDPLRAALAVRRLPAASRLRVYHAGAALHPRLEARARRETATNPRYRWLGFLPPRRTRRLVAGSHLLVLSSRLEGGANALVEALVDGVPVLATDVPGNVGLLGRAYPGYFPVGDTAALRALLRRAEEDEAFRARLSRAARTRAPYHRPARERAAWRRLLGDLGGTGG